MGCDIHLYAERYRCGFGAHPDWWEKFGPSPRLDWAELISPDDHDVPETIDGSTPEECLADYRQWVVENYWNRHDDNLIDGNRSYAWFGFLADVKNYSESPVVSRPRGLPPDLSHGMRAVVRYWDRYYPGAAHSHSWLLLSELLEIDYSQRFTDRRDRDQEVVLRDFLGPTFFDIFKRLRSLGDPASTRLVFFFDS